MKSFDFGLENGDLLVLALYFVYARSRSKASLRWARSRRAITLQATRFARFRASGGCSVAHLRHNAPEDEDRKLEGWKEIRFLTKMIARDETEVLGLRQQGR